MAGGALARTALGVVAGFVAAPIVASASAGIRGWRKAGETLVAQDKAQRAGEEIPQTEKMKQAEARIVEINTALANVDDEHVKSELSAELSELNTVARGTTKNMIEAVRSVGEDEPGYRGSVAKIDALVGKLKQAEDAGADTAAIASQLKRRIAYTQLKISEGKMVFGGKAERLANQYALTRSLGDAEAMLAVETATDVNGEKATARLEKLLGKTDEEIASAEFRFKRNQALRAGAIGGVLAGAGVRFGPGWHL